MTLFPFRFCVLEKEELAEAESTLFRKTIVRKFSKAAMIAKTAKIQPTVTPTVYHCDSKKIPFELTNAFDTVITSPPYPNRISYIRELRPYMYWLDFLSSSEQASVMDWNTIGGTWGSATSRLSTWTCDDTQLPSYLYDIVGQINRADI